MNRRVNKITSAATGFLDVDLDKNWERVAVDIAVNGFRKYADEGSEFIGSAFKTTDKEREFICMTLYKYFQDFIKRKRVAGDIEAMKQYDQDRENLRLIQRKLKV